MISNVIDLAMIVVLIKSCLCSTEYVISDGIKVSKLDFESATNVKDEDYLDLKSEERQLEYSLQIKEKLTERNTFPNRCHVCRLFVEELVRFLVKNGEIELEREGRTPIFVKNGNVMYRAMQEVCSELKNYRVSRIRDFRYTRDGSSPLREAFTQAQKKTRVKQWMYSFPESELDDPTGEIMKLQSKCENLIESEEDRIINWFFKAQNYDPWKWLCADRILKGEEETECLQQSMDITQEYAQKIEENAKAALEKRKNNMKDNVDNIQSFKV